MKSILNPEFKYVPAAKTDLRKTFQRIRKEIAEREKETVQKVEPIRKLATGR